MVRSGGKFRTPELITGARSEGNLVGNYSPDLGVASKLTLSDRILLQYFNGGQNMCDLLG